ncbi:MAG: hypothetical protein ACXWU2_05845, partial [Allosphingosinicella sp.]
MTKVKIPKRVAGVKIPKKVRKQAKKALKATDNPVVRKFAAAAIGAAAQSGTDRVRRWEQAGSRSVDRIDVKIDGERIVETIRSAALEGINRFLAGVEEGLRNAARESGEAEPGQ